MMAINLQAFYSIVSLIRIKHWIKNFFVLVPLVFSGSITDIHSLNAVATTFLLFCLCASSIYVINDIFDIEKDRRHPKKQHRALPSGRLSLSTAWIVALALIVLAVLLSFSVNPITQVVVLTYFLMNLAYSTVLKHEVLLDVLVIAMCFVLRVVAGAFAISWFNIEWLLLVTFFISLFLALGKRRHELLFTDDQDGGDHRPVLKHYNEKLLDYLIVISATLTIITYLFYVINRDYFILTLPFVIYGMFRYMHIVYTQDSGGDPTETVSKDKVLIANVGGWSLIVTSVLIFAK